jgi:hypothetical protein
MATAAFHRWVTAGRPWRLGRPIDQIRTLARSAGVPWLGDLGNEAHLTAGIPEDHTPFSVTAWPVPLVGYVVCAIDLGDGPWSDRILADARVDRLPWLKYMNFRGHHYNIKRGWQQESSSDAHLHLSIRSDAISADIRPWNPFTPAAVPAPIQQTGPSMFIVKAQLTSGTSWYASDGLRFRGPLDWDSVQAMRTITGISELTVTSPEDLELLAGVRDTPTGDGIDTLTDDQIQALASRLTLAFDPAEMRTVFREELAGLHITPGTTLPGM